MSIEAQLERLNTNLENLVGAIAANTSVASALANTGPTALEASLTKVVPKKTTKPKEEVKAEAPAPAPAPVAEAAPAPAAEVPQAEADPFADDSVEAIMASAPTYTLDDVREAGLKLKDKIGLEKTREFIAKFGVSTIKDVPPSRFAEFVTAAKKAAA